MAYHIISVVFPLDLQIKDRSLKTLDRSEMFRFCKDFLTRRNHYYIVLIIYTFFSSAVGSQNLLLKIKGKDEVETKVIDSLNYVKIHDNLNSVLNEIDSIQSILYKKGFIESNTQSNRKINDSTYLAILNLNIQYKSILIYYDYNFFKRSFLSNISKNITSDFFEIKFKDLEKTLKTINEQISKDGQPFSKVSLSEISIANNNLEARLIIQQDEISRTIDNIIIRGYEKFPKSFLKHFLKIQPNKIFNLSRLKEKAENLKDLKFANQTKPPEILFTKDSTTVYLYIEKAKSNNFDGFLGFGTNEDTGNLEFDGYLNLNLNNNLNYGETFRLLYKSDENDQKTFDAFLSLPYLFGSPIGSEFNLNIFKRDSSFTNARQSAKLFYQINPYNKIISGIRSIKSNNLLSNVSSQNISDFDATFFSLGYEWLKQDTDSFLFPINSMIQTNSDFGKRRGSFFEENQSIFSLDAFKIFRLNNRNSIYTRINAALISSDNYLENELLRFGGINFVRGFEENSLYASLYGLTNFEYRYLLSNTVFVNSITDIAYFENKIDNTKQKIFGLGFGFGTLTKAGLFRLIYANGKTEDQSFRFSNSKVHISLTAQF